MVDSLNACKWLFLRAICEPVDNSLRLVVAEARAEGPPEDIELLPGKVLSGSRAIETSAACQVFELVWPTYVAYSVRNESFCSLDDQEVWEGRLLCRYSKSHFLDYVARSTFASSDYPGPLQHWGVNCLNHIVDVVSTEEPAIRLLANAVS